MFFVIPDKSVPTSFVHFRLFLKIFFYPIQAEHGTLITDNGDSDSVIFLNALVIY